jgi:hypothetical protein
VFCLAVDNHAHAVTWSGSGWSAPTSVSTPGGGSAQLGPLSCPTAGLCAVPTPIRAEERALNRVRGA